MSKSNILILINGSIAAYKVCELISTLVKEGFAVKIAASKNALRFVGEATLEGLSGNPVYHDLWEAGRMMDHIDLNRWADLILVAPATASFINRSAAGTGDDLLTTLFLAHDFKKPFLVAPAMNQSMYQHPVTQQSLTALIGMGIELLEPNAGSLACGEVGPGRLMEPKEIFSRIKTALESKRIGNTSSKGKVLITAGGTSEAIDEVRVLTNKSTGATGAAIADQLIRDGFNVTFLSAENSVKPTEKCTRLEFTNFEQLEQNLKLELVGDYIAVIHSAAVSDYSPEKQSGKISSDKEVIHLELKKNPKLVNELKNWSANKSLKLIAFKLTATESLEQQDTAVKKLFKDSGADWVIQNDYYQFHNDPSNHEYQAFTTERKIFQSKTREELAKRISEELRENQL